MCYREESPDEVRERVTREVEQRKQTALIGTLRTLYRTLRLYHDTSDKSSIALVTMGPALFSQYTVLPAHREPATDRGVLTLGGTRVEVDLDLSPNGVAFWSDAPTRLLYAELVLP